jgi:hypothetical protein
MAYPKKEDQKGYKAHTQCKREYNRLNPAQTFRKIEHIKQSVTNYQGDRNKKCE